MQKLTLVFIGVLSVVAIPEPRPLAVPVSVSDLLPSSSSQTPPLPWGDGGIPTVPDYLRIPLLNWVERRGSVYDTPTDTRSRVEEDGDGVHRERGDHDGYSEHMETSRDIDTTIEEGMSTETDREMESETTTDTATTAEAETTETGTMQTAEELAEALSSITTSSINSTTEPSETLTILPSTTASADAKPTSLSLLPHWSYEKSCIAAASILTTAVVVACFVLGAIYFRRIQRWWNRRKQGQQEYSAMPLVDKNTPLKTSPLSRRIRREAVMFSRDCSPSMAFVVEESKDGNPTRVYYANNNVSVSTVGQVEAMARTPSRQSRPATANLGATGQQTPGRSEVSRLSFDLGGSRVVPRQHMDQARGTQPPVDNSKPSNADGYPLLPALSLSTSPIMTFPES